MKLPELVQDILKQDKKIPYIIAFEGMIGSGKSYEAEKLKQELNSKVLLVSTDLFVRVPRSEWAERLLDDDINLSEWYDLEKIKEALELSRKRKLFTIKGLYNLSNGRFDDEIEIDGRDFEYIILEGLFSCSRELDGLIDYRVFLDVPREIALKRAHRRDETVRHLDHSGWLRKKHIFYDHYLPYMKLHKDRADAVLENG